MAVVPVERDDDRLERRRRKFPLERASRLVADQVADLDLAQTRDPGDLARPHRRARDDSALDEDAEPGDLACAVAAEAHPVARPERPREHADVRNLLAAG